MQRIDWWLPGVGGWESVGVGIWDQKMQTGIYRMNKQSPTV